MTQSENRPGWTLRPAAKDVRTAFACAGILLLLFVTTYAGCNWLTAQRSDHYRFYFDWELDVPFVPGMVGVYLSLLVTFVLPMFCLRQDDLILLSRRLAWSLILAGACFLALPAHLGYERADPAPGWETVFRLIHALDLPHNLVPSLHIIWSALILATLRAASPAWARRLFEVWFALICVSVVLVHQHHLADVFGGMLAAAAVAWAVRAGERRGFSGALQSTQVQGRVT